MEPSTAARSPRRILIRGSKFKKGDKVRIPMEFEADIIGVVIGTHISIGKPGRDFVEGEDPDKIYHRPGVDVRATEGYSIGDEFTCWDIEVVGG